jgi:hypothetical protein
MFDVTKEFVGIERQAPIESGDLGMAHDKPGGHRAAKGSGYCEQRRVKRKLPA